MPLGFGSGSPSTLGYSEDCAMAAVRAGGLILEANREYAKGRFTEALPLYEEAVEYADGTEATLEQLAHDVSVFLAWTAEPELEVRKKTGLKVLIFIAIFTALLYIIKRRIWAKLH